MTTTTVGSGVGDDVAPRGLMRHGPRGERPTRYSIASAILGTLGELLITLGVILGLYVAWELVWTNVEADRTQQTYQAAFEENPEYVAPPADPAAVGEKHTDGAPAIAPPAELSVFAELYVPRWNDRTKPYVRTITEGVSKEQVLNVTGIGHYPETQLPGQLGNFALAAHRSTYGKPFSEIDKLEVGDPIVVETDKYWYVYHVTDSEIVYPGDTEVIGAIPTRSDGAPVPPMTELPEDGNPQYAYITLTTCHPYTSAKQRYIVWGVFDYWMDKSQGTPPELTGSEG